MGVPACCAVQSACYGLRYRFGADRTMRASTHALRMPNAGTRAYMHYAQDKSRFFCTFVS